MADKELKHFENEGLGVKFAIPERLTVRQNLAFQGRTAMTPKEDGVFIRFWNGALPLITEWECESIPDPEALNLDEEDDAKIADIVLYVSNAVAGHITTIGDVPKND